ncbi:hypothetical protein PENTCL1PPCAC_19462, partial [Pristionchus entomophagus]
PQYSLLDPANRYKQGQELFVHTRLKPFSLIHPNSSIAPYHSESLVSMADNDHRILCTASDPSIRSPSLDD